MENQMQIEVKMMRIFDSRLRIPQTLEIIEIRDVRSSFRETDENKDKKQMYEISTGSLCPISRQVNPEDVRKKETKFGVIRNFISFNDLCLNCISIEVYSFMS